MLLALWFNGFTSGAFQSTEIGNIVLKRACHDARDDGSQVDEDVAITLSDRRISSFLSRP
jgi:hypothetical protein